MLDLKNIEIVQEITKDKNVQCVDNVKNYINQNAEIREDRKLCRKIVVRSAVMLILTDLIIFACSGNRDLTSRIVHIVVLLVQHICFVVIFYKALNYTYQELSKKYSAYELFVFIVTNPVLIRKAKMSRDRKKLKLYRKYYEEVLDSSNFEVLGMGNNVYKIDLDNRIIFVN